MNGRNFQRQYKNKLSGYSDQSALLTLSEKEKQGLQQIGPTLLKLTVSELTAFKKVFVMIENQKLGNKQWNTALQDAVYDCNQAYYETLVNMIME